MTNTLRESIMVAAMEGDLSRLLVLGRDGLGRPLLLGGETLNVLGWSGPPAMPRNAVWEDFIQEGFGLPTFSGRMICLSPTAWTCPTDFLSAGCLTRRITAPTGS